MDHQAIGYTRTPGRTAAKKSMVVAKNAVTDWTRDIMDAPAFLFGRVVLDNALFNGYPCAIALNATAGIF